MRSLFLVEFDRSVRETWSYKLNIVLANFSLLILFSGIVRYTSADLTYQTQISIMFCWYLCTHGIVVPTYIVEEEIMDETLINIVASKHSIFNIILIRMLVQYIIDVMKIVVMLTLVILITGVSFTLNQLIILFLMMIFVAIISILIGIILATFTMKYEKTSHFTSLFNYFILFFTGGMFIISSNFLDILNSVIPYQTFNIFMEKLYSSGVFEYKLLITLFIQLLVYTPIAYFLLNRSIKKKQLRGEF